jgi:DUF4097 and DUF4098 domain-containing protein YvlB
MPYALRLAAPLALVVSTVPLTGACVISVDSQGQIVRDERRYTVSGVPEVHLTTFDGAIEIDSWDRPDVLIEIEKRGPTREAVDELQIVESQNGRRIDFEVKQPRSRNFSIGINQSASAKLKVSLPRRSDVVARSGDGSIRIERVEGRLEIRTGDGAIRAADVSGELTMNTGDGSVNVDHARGRLTVSTGDGGVEVSGRLSGVKLHTGDGSIVYRAEAESTMDDNWDITTGDGGVTVYLPRGFNAEIDAHTGDGGISNDLDVVTEARTDDGERSRRTLKGRLGDGGRVLRIRTGDGAIRLRSS